MRTSGVHGGPGRLQPAIVTGHVPGCPDCPHMCGSLTNVTRIHRRARVNAMSIGTAGLVVALAAGGSPSATTADDQSGTPSPTKKAKSATPTPTSASPTYTRKPTPTPTPTKPPGALFVATLPDSVPASVGQRVVVQLPTEPNERYGHRRDEHTKC